MSRARRPSVSTATANFVFGQTLPRDQSFVAHRFAPRREKPLDTTNRIIECKSPSYIYRLGESQFRHICIAFDRPYDPCTNTGGTVWICHPKYNYPKYSVHVGLDKEVMGQIQELPSPFGSRVVRMIADMYIWEIIKDAALDVLLGLTIEGRNGDLSLMLGPLKTALDLIPDSKGNDQLQEHWNMRLVEVINALTNDVLPGGDEDEVGKCCVIL